MNNNGVFIGTELKFKINISAPGFNMDTDDWSITIVQKKTKVEYKKEDCVAGEDGWFVCFDTRDFGTGSYYAIVTAYVPDSDFEDGLRTEVKKFHLLNVESV